MVVNHLGRKSALKIEDERLVEDARGKRADERAFVQVGVDEVGFVAADDAQDAGGEEHVESDFVARGADFVVDAPRDGHGALDFDAGKVAARADR